MAIVFDSDAGTITGISVGGLPDGVVDAGTLASNAVTEAKIASSAVVTAKLNDDAVTNAKVAANAIAEAQLAANAVVTGKIEDGTITNADVNASAAIVGTKLVMPAGSILQTVRGAITSSVEGSTSFDIMNVNITPKQADSDMLITVYVQWSILATNGNTGDDWGMVLNRASSAILGDPINNYFISGGGVDAVDWAGQGSGEYGVNFASKMDLDTGRSSGTSQINYKLTMHKASGSGNKTIRFMRDGWGGSSGESQRSNCVIIVQEVAT
jgi:hypothetical protein